MLPKLLGYLSILLFLMAVTEPVQGWVEVGRNSACLDKTNHQLNNQGAIIAISNADHLQFPGH